MKRIGLIDSGIGGVTILNQLIRQYPNLHFFYFGDQKYCPYGDKSDDEVIDRVLKISDFLINEKQVEMIIVACNTATAVALEKLKKHVSIPVIGIIDICIAEAISNSSNSHFDIIGTSLTIKSNTYKKKLKQFNESFTVNQQACGEFVDYIENDYNNSDLLYEIIDNKLHMFKENGSDTLILGCTHFPLIADEISEYFNHTKRIIDPKKVIVSYIKQYIYDFGNDKGNVHIYTSGDEVVFANKIKRYFDIEVDGIESIKI